ncbi:MAG: helix-turn-helix domain-containing protein [Gemmatimonadales bacterium]
MTLPREALLELFGGAGGEGPAASAGDVRPDASVDLTVSDLAQAFGRSPSTIRQWLQSEQLDGYKLFGREWRVTPNAVAAFQERQRLGRAHPPRTERRTPSLSDWRSIR